jgi:cell division septal protein FtsQ
VRATRLLSPRAIHRAYDDVSERPALIVSQRVRRAAARRARRRIAATLTGLAVAGALALGALAAHFVLTAPRFAVTAVDVRGASRVAPRAIAEAAAIAPGTNLLRLRPDEVERRVEALPAIRHAEVIRSWPNRVTIVVEERRPFTLVHAGRLHWVDEEGVPVGVEREAVAPRAPVISGLTPDELAVMRERPSPRAQAAIALIRMLLRSGSSLVDQISEIDVSRPDEPVLYTVDGVEVRLGADNWDGRLARLEGVLGQLAAAPEPVTSIDLRFRDQVVLNGGGSR